MTGRPLPHDVTRSGRGWRDGTPRSRAQWPHNSWRSAQRPPPRRLFDQAFIQEKSVLSSTSVSGNALGEVSFVARTDGQGPTFKGTTSSRLT